MNRNRITTRLAARLRLLPLWLVIAMIWYLAICAWYNVFQFTVFAGDDLRSFEAARGGFTGYNEMMISFYKFRPVTALLFGIVAFWTNCDFRAVASVSLMLHTVNGFLFFYLVHRQIRLPLLVSIGLTAIAIFNRFGTYLFMQDSALTGGLGIALFLLTLIVAWPFLERPTVGRALGLIILYAAIIHTYEPYLVLGLPLVLLGVCTFRLNRLAASVVATGAIIGALSNFLIKKFCLATPFLIGTETRPLAFDVPQILLFGWRGFLNLVGINSGPTYLSLEDFPQSPLWMRIVSVAAAVLSIGLLLGSLASIMASERRQKTRFALFRLVLYASAIAGLLLAASITFRQLYSWLYPAYLGFLVFLGFAVQASKTRRRSLQHGLTCLILLSMSRELYLSRRHSQFFAFQSEEIAKNLAATLRHIDDIGARDEVLIRGDVPAADWVFMEGAFSRFYHLPALEFIGRNEPVGQTDGSRVILNYIAAEYSFRIREGKEAATAAAPAHRMNFTALEAPAAAFVPNDQWSTPTKTPVFRMSKNGLDCMIEVAPVEIVVPVVPPATVLYVCFSHVYAIGDGADVEIVASSRNGSTPLFSSRVPPLTNNDFPVWRKYEFALPPETEQIQLRVLSKTDPAADWIAIRDFSFN
jgi:hypothetical protein